MPQNFYGASPVSVESVSAVTATPSVQLGTKRTENGEDYIYLYNNGNTQITVGAGVIISALSGYSVTVSSLTNLGAFVAVNKHATVASAYYFWGMTRGFASVLGTASTALAAGDPIGPGLNGTWSQQTGALTMAIQGTVLVATGSGGVGMAYVRCFG